MTFTFVSMTHFKEALQGQLPHRCPQVAPQGPSTACFLIASQTRLRGSQTLPGAAEHPQLPPNTLGSQKEDLPFTVLFKAASLLVLLEVVLGMPACLWRWTFPGRSFRARCHT